MNVNLDFWNVQLGKLSKTELELVDRVRKALMSVNLGSIQLRSGEYIAEALITIEPFRIDFRAFVPGEIGQAFIGPQVKLTDELFDGDVLKKSFIKELTQNFEEFKVYIIEKSV